MTQPESRTVEERLRDVLAVTSMPWYDDANPDYSEAVETFLVAAKEHGLVIGEGELEHQALKDVHATGYAAGFEAAQEVPPAGTRLVLVAEGLLGQFGTRTERGERITAEWGEPDKHGWYTPTFTAHSEDVIGEGELDAALEQIAKAADFRATIKFDKGWHGADLLDGIAAWMDKIDEERGNPDHSVQTDMRRWARELRAAFERLRR